MKKFLESSPGARNKIFEGKKLPSAESIRDNFFSAGFEKESKAYEKVLEIARAIEAAGGQALLVGGAVRDMAQGIIPKDFDIEVYRLHPEKIEEIVSAFGKVSEVGKAFGILKVAAGEGIDIDVSLPRMDSKIGAGHRGFEVKTDPSMSIADAARRRDFTINSLAADPLTSEIYDYYGGLADLKNKILRVTDPERFRDDPLRVLRALQFMGRLGLSLEPKSAELMREMAPELKELPRERIFEEWKKLLLKSIKPSVGLSAGMALGIFKEIHPEFPPLAKTPQEPEWHPEGDAWVHTLMAVDEAAKIIREEKLPADEALPILLATLCHDLGKPETTEIKEGRIISHGHEEKGEEPTKKFLDSLGTDNLTYDKVKKLVINHLKPTLLYIADGQNKDAKKGGVSDGAIRDLAKRIFPATIRELVMVAQADHQGRGPFADPEISEQLLLPDGFPAGPWLLKRARKLEVEKSKPAPLTQGRDWLALGFPPGKNVGMLIKLADRLRDEKNLKKEDVFSEVFGIKDSKEAVSILENLLKNS